MRRGASALVLPAYVAAALLLTWPLVRDARHAIPTGSGLPDALLQAFLVEWDLHALSTRPGAVFDVPIFHPEKNTLTYMDHLLGEAVVAAPLAARGGLALGYDLVVWLSFVASAWATYRLARRIGVSREGAFLAGALFAFSPYRLGNMANLNLLQTEFIPLALYFAFGVAHHGRARDLFAAAVTLAVQSYFSWYHTFHLATALATLALWRAWTHGARFDARRLAIGLGAILLTAALVAPGVWPYLEQRRAMPGFERSLGSAAFWSADVLDYLKVNVENRALGHVGALAGNQPYAPGWLATLLAAIAMIGLIRDARLRAAARTSSAVARLGARARAWGDAGAVAAIGVVGFVLSLGPLLRVAGRRLWVPLPYAALFYAVPGFASMRAPGRFAVLVALSVATLAGTGYDRVRRRVGAGAGRPALFAATCVALLALTWSVPWPTLHLPSPADLPPVYRWLAARPGAEPVLDVPVPARESDEGAREITRQFYAVYHRKPLVDGVSGFVPPVQRVLRTRLQEFPERSSLQAAADRGARLVLVHYGDWPEPQRTRVRDAVAREPALRPLATFGDDAAYALTLPAAP
jgi:hypothetical protein